MDYMEIVERRRALRIPGYVSLTEIGFDGPWVCPYQIGSCSPTGPVLVADNWFDVDSFRANEPILRKLGYMPGIKFNNVVDRALHLASLRRSAIYVTQAFHLLAPGRDRSPDLKMRNVYASFGAITRHELTGRKVFALGSRVAAACKKFGVRHNAIRHPSARTGTNEERAQELANALVS